MEKQLTEQLTNASLKAVHDVITKTTEVSHFEFHPFMIDKIPDSYKVVGVFMNEEVWKVIVKPALARFMQSTED